MDKELLAYLGGSKNAVLTPFLTVREITPSGMHHIIQYLPDVKEPIYDFWFNPNRKPGSKPKHIGGQKPYVKLFLQEIDALRKDGLTDEIAGSLLRLVKYITWSTGVLKNKRSKNPFKFDDMVVVLGLSRSHTIKRIKQFRDLDILWHTSDGYVISPKLIKKGGA